MTEYVKISNKKSPLPKASTSGWKFTKRPGGWILAESASGERKKFYFHQLRNQFSISIQGELFFGEWLEESYSGAGKAGQSDIDGELTAQFPGKVRKVLVQSGASVQEGDTLLLVEAMKMEFAIKAPASGKIKKVLVHEGQQLSPGDRFVDLEVAASES